MTLLVAPQPHQQLVLLDTSLVANLMGIKYLIIVLICISLTTNQIKYLVTHLSAIRVFSCKL